jgi:hypothetical protein
MTKRIPSDNRILAKHAAAIRRLGKRVVADVIEIGRRLTEAKPIAGHGNWLAWLEREFKWTEMTATRFINVYEMSKSNNLLDLELPISGLYLLAAPSTSKEARDEIIERAQAGETVPVAEVKRTIERAKGRKPKQGLRGKRALSPRGDDTGPSSAGEAERLRCRIEELQAQVRQRDITIEGLRRDIAELQKTSGDPMSVSEFQATIRKWEDTVETQRGIIARLENENATLRAGVGAPPDDGLDIPASLRRAPR